MIEIFNWNCLDVLKLLEKKSVHTCITSPPYWGLRDYDHEDQIGLEVTPERYIANIVAIFSEVRRILRDDGTIWLNLGDSYSGSGRGPEGNLNKGENFRNTGTKHKPYKNSKIKGKNLLGLPWRVALALQEDGWYLRQDIIWHKPNPMPESVSDRCTRAHEYIFLLSKSNRYYFDNISIKENTKNGRMRNKRSVWTVCTKGFKGAHFATFPTELIEPCIRAGSPVGGIVLDPFGGSGTTGYIAKKLKRDAILIEINKNYVEIACERIFGKPQKEHNGVVLKLPVFLQSSTHYH